MQIIFLYHSHLIFLDQTHLHIYLSQLNKSSNHRLIIAGLAINIMCGLNIFVFSYKNFEIFLFFSSNLSIALFKLLYPWCISKCSDKFCFFFSYNILGSFKIFFHPLFIILIFFWAMHTYWTA